MNHLLCVIYSILRNSTCFYDYAVRLSAWENSETLEIQAAEVILGGIHQQLENRVVIAMKIISPIHRLLKLLNQSINLLNKNSTSTDHKSILLTLEHHKQSFDDIQQSVLVAVIHSLVSLSTISLIVTKVCDTSSILYSCIEYFNNFLPVVIKHFGDSSVICQIFIQNHVDILAASIKSYKQSSSPQSQGQTKHVLSNGVATVSNEGMNDFSEHDDTKILSSSAYSNISDKPSKNGDFVRASSEEKLATDGDNIGDGVNDTDTKDVIKSLDNDGTKNNQNFDGKFFVNNVISPALTDLSISTVSSFNSTASRYREEGIQLKSPDGIELANNKDNFQYTFTLGCEFVKLTRQYFWSASIDLSGSEAILFFESSLRSFISILKLFVALREINFLDSCGLKILNLLDAIEISVTKLYGWLDKLRCTIMSNSTLVSLLSLVEICSIISTR